MGSLNVLHEKAGLGQADFRFFRKRHARWRETLIELMAATVVSERTQREIHELCIRWQPHTAGIIQTALYLLREVTLAKVQPDSYPTASTVESWQ
jgi:hypothetical protein